MSKGTQAQEAQQKWEEVRAQTAQMEQKGREAEVRVP